VRFRAYFIAFNGFQQVRRRRPNGCQVVDAHAEHQ
jgi:hypothetical protein